MADSNKSKIEGDGNMVIQGLKAGGNITIVAGNDTDPKLKDEKERIGYKIAELVEELRKIEEIPSGQTDSGEQADEPTDENYKKIDWEELVGAIEFGTCVLFIGPEISVDKNGISLHDKFYMDMAKKHPEVEYIKEEGFLSPGADKEILLDVLRYYKKRKFDAQNEIGRRILQKFAQIPFSLIISLCPDDTIHHVYNDFNIEHTFSVYDTTKTELGLKDNDNTLVFNMLGNASDNGSYVYTHENYFEYLKNEIIPPEIKDKIQKATHYLFIGFDFNKWYNRLVLFVLEFKEKRGSSVDRVNIDNKSVAKQFKNYIDKQFSITSINNDYEEFAGWLLRNARQEEGIVINLSESFISSTFETLKKLGRNLSDAEKFKDLDSIQKDAADTKIKIESFKQLIA